MGSVNLILSFSLEPTVVLLVESREWLQCHSLLATPKVNALNAQCKDEQLMFIVVLHNDIYYTLNLDVTSWISLLQPLSGWIKVKQIFFPVPLVLNVYVAFFFHKKVLYLIAFKVFFFSKNTLMHCNFAISKQEKLK